MEQRRKLGALREQETTLFINGDNREAAERRDEAADLERRLKHGS